MASLIWVPLYYICQVTQCAKATVSHCRCVAKLQSKGLKVLCDIVINHRCAQKQDKNGIWNVFGGKMAWDAEAIVVNDRKFKGRGNRATGDEFAAAPNIDHMQDYVRKDLTDWMEWLRDEIGFDGWRCAYSLMQLLHACADFCHDKPSCSIQVSTSLSCVSATDDLNYLATYLQHPLDAIHVLHAQ